MSRDLLTCTVFEEFMTQFHCASSCSKRERERETFRRVFQKQLGAGIFLVESGPWRPPLQGIECGAGTESDDATAAEPLNLLQLSHQVVLMISVAVSSSPRIIDT